MPSAEGTPRRAPGPSMHDLDDPGGQYWTPIDRPAPLTAAQKAEHEALAALPDDQTEASAIPPLYETFRQNAVRNSFYRPE
jgi:hypothetical protein